MSETTIEEMWIDQGTLHLRHNPDYSKPYWVVVTAELQLRMRPLTIGMYRSRRCAERCYRRYAAKHALDKRSRGGKNYTPPTFEEFESILGAQRSPFEIMKLYDSMRLAMSCEMYDHDEALGRLRDIAKITANLESIATTKFAGGHRG